MHILRHCCAAQARQKAEKAEKARLKAEAQAAAAKAKAEKGETKKKVRPATIVRRQDPHRAIPSAGLIALHVHWRWLQAAQPTPCLCGGEAAASRYVETCSSSLH